MFEVLVGYRVRNWFVYFYIGYWRCLWLIYIVLFDSLILGLGIFNLIFLEVYFLGIGIFLEIEWICDKIIKCVFV